MSTSLSSPDEVVPSAIQTPRARLARRESIRPWRSVEPFLLMVGIAVASGILVLWLTRYGLRVGSDSVEFLVAARNLAGGVGLGLFGPNGSFMPLRLHPPLYPLALTALDLAGLEPLVATRYLNAVLASGVVLIVGLVVLELTRSVPLSVGAALMTATWAPLINVYSGALSEPVFIFLGVACVGMLAYGVRQDKWLIVVAAGLLAGLAGVTRYQGVTLAAVGPTYLLVFDRGTRMRKFKRAAVFFLLAVIPLALWSAHLRISYGVYPSEGDIRISDLWQRMEPLRGALADLAWNWLPGAGLLPGPAYRTKLALLAGGVMVALVVIVPVMRQKRTGPWRREGARVDGAVLLLLAALAYGVLTAMAYAFRVPTPDLNERTLFPMTMAATGAALVVLSVILETRMNSWLREYAAGLAAILLFGLGIPKASTMAQAVSPERLGLASPRWRNSCVLSAVGDLPAEISLISNATAAVLLYQGTYPYEIPELEGGSRVQVDAQFGSGNSPAEALFRSRDAALVLFEPVVWDLASVYGDEAEARKAGMTRGLEVYVDCWDGRIYMSPADG